MSRKVLVVVAHPDDEVLGCGGTVLKHVIAGDEVRLLVMADGETSRESHSVERRNECLEEAARLLGVQECVALRFPDNRMDSVALIDVVKEVESVVSSFSPDTVYTHSHCDLNIDHQVTHRAVMTACRPQGEATCSVKRISSFYIPSSTEWGLRAGSCSMPHSFVDISDTLEKKMEILKVYDEEINPAPHARSYHGVRAAALYWGSTVGLHAAEPFWVERELVRSL